MNEPEAYAYQADGGTGGPVAPTLVGGHERCISDYTAIILIKEIHKADPETKGDNL